MAGAEALRQGSFRYAGHELRALRRVCITSHRQPYEMLLHARSSAVASLDAPILLAKIVGMADEPTTNYPITAFEVDAEFLVLEQLDLLAQVEAQLRAVHHTMRRIEKLRNPKHRVGPALSDGVRGDTLAGLSAELEALDSHLATQHSCCHEMLNTVERMRNRLALAKGQTAPTRDLSPTPESGEGPSESGVGG
jgi:hypothetical protein